jgi:hypothetical protein
VSVLLTHLDTNWESRFGHTHTTIRRCGWERACSRERIDIVFALNGSAPGPNHSTDILGTLFYRTFFGSSGQVSDLDLGATVASVIFLLILVTTAAYFALLHRRLRTYEL